MDLEHLDISVGKNSHEDVADHSRNSEGYDVVPVSQQVALDEC